MRRRSRRAGSTRAVGYVAPTAARFFRGDSLQQHAPVEAGGTPSDQRWSRVAVVLYAPATRSTADPSAVTRLIQAVLEAAARSPFPFSRPGPAWEDQRSRRKRLGRTRWLAPLSAWRVSAHQRRVRTGSVIVSDVVLRRGPARISQGGLAGPDIEARRHTPVFGNTCPAAPEPCASRSTSRTEPRNRNGWKRRPPNSRRRPPADDEGAPRRHGLAGGCPAVLAGPSPFRFTSGPPPAAPTATSSTASGGPSTRTTRSSSPTTWDSRPWSSSCGRTGGTPL